MARNTITEEDLAAAGAMIGPGGNVILIKDKEKPNESWSMTQLAHFVRQREQAALGFGKAEAVERYFQGHAVHLAHNRCKENGTKWIEWCEPNLGINRMRAWRSERLYLAAGKVWGEEAVKEVSKHSITALYLKFGILRNRERRPKDDDHADQPGAQDFSEPANNGDSAQGTHRRTRTQADHADRRDQSRSTIRLISDDEDQAVNEEEGQASDEVNGEGAQADDSEIEEHDEQKVLRKFDFTERVGRVASVTRLEPGKFLLEVSDDSIVFKLTLDRAMLEAIHEDSEQEMEEDDACEFDLKSR